MFGQNHKSLENWELQQVNDNSSESKDLETVEYRQPKVHHLGDLEKVQANYEGRFLDGNSSNFRYDG